MPTIQRGDAKLHYYLDDFTDPWRDSPDAIVAYSRFLPPTATLVQLAAAASRSIGSSGRICGEWAVQALTRRDTNPHWTP